MQIFAAFYAIVRKFSGRFSGEYILVSNCPSVYDCTSLEMGSDWPADGGGVGLVLAEAVDALDGGGLDVVAQEQPVVPPGTTAGLLQHHQHHGLHRVAVARRRIPVVPLELGREIFTEYRHFTSLADNMPW